MQEEIKYIELILENCEVIRIDGKYIGDFDIENIKRSISRLGCNYIGKINKCDSFTISIYRDADVEKPIEWTMGFTGDIDKPFPRLHKEKDIFDVWDLQELNDEDDFKWKMFGCREDEELEEYYV